MDSLLQSRPRALAECSVCGEIVERNQDGRARGHYAKDPAHAVAGNLAYYCRGASEMTRPLGKALRTEISVTWHEHVTEEQAVGDMRKLAQWLSDQTPVERVRVVTRSREST